MSPGQRVVVVGAGITGLSCAYRLRDRGFEVLVLEASDAVGGKMSSVRRDGYVVNRAANILPSSYAAVRGLAQDVGLGGRIGAMPVVLGVPRDGRMHRLRASGPGMLVDGLRTSLLSVRGKLLLRRMLVDALRMKGSLSYANLGAAARFDTETVAEYCERRLSPEVRDYLVEPILRALFTCNADTVSIVDFFFAAVNFVGSGMMRYPGGIDFLVRELASRLDVRLSARVTSVTDEPDGVRVSWTGPDGVSRVESADACVLAVSGAVVPALYPGLDASRREILTSKLRYCVTYAGHFALRRRPSEPSLVVPVPRAEDENLCVVVFSHNAGEACVPSPSAGLLSTYWLHEWSSSRRLRTDDEVIAEMLPAMAKVVPSIEEDLVFARLDRWDPAVVRSYPGWYTHVARLGELADAGGRIQLAGDYLSASSTNACAVAGEEAAGRVARVLAGGSVGSAVAR
ncbi:NAD(P)/FAD-dependent oxidoreductase [Pseudonocardia eucalypti]|uniref:NAD(P)/FAD-dependent oxidoreductase n=1 Tax=Pseudonocardia eucalypti TaxID=648755 RepID=A0ABP9QAV9_9PSEU|nr:oxygen-dependent protoporphyrinogen oxidase [Pseudonocardia eucalypti]